MIRTFQWYRCFCKPTQQRARNMNIRRVWMAVRSQIYNTDVRVRDRRGDDRFASFDWRIVFLLVCRVYRTEPCRQLGSQLSSWSDGFGGQCAK
jgi:hypothetical protein